MAKGVMGIFQLIVLIVLFVFVKRYLKKVKQEETADRRAARRLEESRLKSDRKREQYRPPARPDMASAYQQPDIAPGNVQAKKEELLGRFGSRLNRERTLPDSSSRENPKVSPPKNEDCGLRAHEGVHDESYDKLKDCDNRVHQPVHAAGIPPARVRAKDYSLASFEPLSGMENFPCL